MTALRRSIEAACAAALAAAALPGCCFGRSYGPSHDEYLHPIDAASAAKASADGTLPSDVCDKACGTFSSAELTGCHVVTMDIPPPPQKRWLTWKYRASSGGNELNNGTLLDPEAADALGDGGELDVSLCQKHAGADSGPIWDCKLAPRKAALTRGAPMAQCHVYVPGGCDMSLGSGRDSHLRSSELMVGTSTLGFLVRSAQLEASSVRAFRDLAGELVRRGARPSLVRAARRAARDEARHARLVRTLCRVRGKHVPPVRFRAPRSRTDGELAYENLILGCVGELFAATVARHQSEAAPAADLRRVAAVLARDEARHAALSFRLFALFLPRLEARERAGMLRALDAAVHALHGELLIGPAAAALGLPEPKAVAALIASLDATAWAPLRRALAGQPGAATSAR